MNAALLEVRPASPDIAFDPSADELLERARGEFVQHLDEARARVAGKRELLHQYDVAGMNRAVAVCHWGRSGSLLLASYLDGHPDVVMLPHGTSENIYPFLLEYGSRSLWEKLIAYPVYSAVRTGVFGDLFLKNNPEGDFAIDPTDYYAAVLALFELFGARPAEWLGTRARFFQMLHVAYSLALGRRLANPRPLMVYAQHWCDQRLADYFIEDFPDGKFIHTIRDPISALDSWFEWKVGSETYRKSSGEKSLQFIDAAVGASTDLLARGWDCGHRGMQSRSRAIRFEDMHIAPEAMLRRLAEWVGIGFMPCLLESTWNGRPYTVTVRGRTWCGPNPANARRRSTNLGVTDRMIVFALEQEHFVSWGYPFPKVFRHRWARAAILSLLWLIPMRTEIRNARLVLQWQSVPSLRRGRIRFALRAPIFLAQSRLRMMRLLASQWRLRRRVRCPLLEVL
ncbi:MAG TPA: sulfotransferase [Steroidobacteraceae bacterium]|nr:sulfotransferase [Steroidobacteraceae bacterium]